MTKKIIALLFCSFISFQVFGWGLTGHRVVGYIAQHHLTKKAQKNIAKLLGDTSLAQVANWMDDIRSDSTYDYTHDWHWVTVKDGETYEQCEKNPHGDVIQTIERLIAELKSDTLTALQKRVDVKMLVHLVGDVHQPLHVGNGKDHGGNNLKVKWFWQNSNLHSVWDSGMIDSEEYSYTELGDIADKATKDQIEKWQSTDVREWARESMALRVQVYDLPEDKSIGYVYRYKNWPTVKHRLEKAGIRLAGVLNDIFG